MSSGNDSLYLIDGIELSDGTFVLACGSAIEPGDLSGTILFYKNDTWQKKTILFDSIVSLAFIGPTCFALGEDGYIVDIRCDISRDDTFTVTSQKLPTFAEMIQIKEIQEGVIAAGMDGQLYEYDGYTWFNKIIELQDVSKFDVQDICGFSMMDYYLVGMGGWIVRWSGKWEKVPSPSNVNLSSACIGVDDLVYVAGDNGILMRGRYDEWEIVTELDYGNDIWSLVCYGSKIYSATSQSIYVLEDDSWKEIELPDIVRQPFNKLYAHGERLWSIGETSVSVFDGAYWTNVAVPNVIIT